MCFVYLLPLGVVKDDEVKAYMNTLRAIVEAKPDSISIHVPQALLWLRDLGYSGAIEADTGLNIFNGSSTTSMARLLI